MSESNEKTLLPVFCAVCGFKGYAYIDTNSKITKLHYCMKHNQKIKIAIKSKPEAIIIKT